VFEVREVGFQFFNLPGHFIWHENILPAHRREVEASLALRCEGNLETIGSEIICRAKLQSKGPPPTC
jgi:hypothetical protein